MNNLISALTVFCIVGSGLVAGTFFAFSTFVMPALVLRPAGEARAAMNEINVVVLRSRFMAIFAGTALASIGLGIYVAAAMRDTAGYMILAGSACYLLLSFAITLAFNVPLNNRLATDSADDSSDEAAWQDYAESWTRWNHVRTVGSIIALLFFVSSLFYR